jgi:hypothetical protein
MNGKTAWSLSAKAFETSRNEHCSRLLRPIFFQFGVTWFWVALALEGRAVEVWRDLRSQSTSAKRLKLAGVWASCADGLRETVLSDGQPCQVPAWSLPDSRKMRSLGLGRMWAVLCPYCQRFHMHSPGEGRRTPHCCANRDDRHYILEFAGPLPLQHHRRFYRTSRVDLPRLVDHWSGTGLSHQPDELLPSELLAA